MNSKQRRQIDRKTKFKVKLNRHGNEEWSAFDIRITEAREWCRKNCKGAYLIDNHFGDGKFKFQKESDAVYFGLTHL